MKVAGTLSCLILAGGTFVGATDVMLTDLNVYKVGARGLLVSKRKPPINQPPLLGDSCGTVVEKIRVSPKTIEYEPGSPYWTIMNRPLKAGMPTMEFRWMADDEIVSRVNPALYGTDELGLVEVTYPSVGLCAPDCSQASHNLDRLIDWISSILGPPIEEPAAQSDIARFHVTWVTDLSQYVHIAWETSVPTGARLTILTQDGPSWSRVKDAVEAQMSQFTMEEFMQIRVGMSLEDVLSTIGSHGELQSEELVDGEVTQTYGWINSDGSSASIVVNDDRIVIRKEQNRLR